MLLATMNRHYLRLITASLALITLCSVAGLAQEAPAPPAPPASAQVGLNDASLVRLREVPAPGASFTFAAFADPHGWAPMMIPPAYQRLIKELNLWQPAFAIASGDLLRGYTPDDKLLTAEWDAFLQASSELTMPLFVAPGNHDIFSRRAAEVWNQRIGPRYVSFDYGDAHFILLNSEEIPKQGQIIDEQLRWLEQDLQGHVQARHIFVFLHKPLWGNTPGIVKGNAWTPLHQLLKRYPVRAVIAGHMHYYQSEELDGIYYIINGPGGGQTGSILEAGEFHDYLLITVAGDQVRYVLVRTGAVDPLDVVTYQNRREVGGLNARLPNPRLEMRPPGRHPAPQVLRFTMTNPSESKLVGTFFWETVTSGWTVAPRRAEFEVEPKSQIQPEFSVTAPRVGTPEAKEAPKLAVTFPYDEGKRQVTLYRTITLVQSYQCPYLKQSPTQYGEWSRKAINLTAWRPEPKQPRELWKGPQDCSAQAWLGWNEQALYLSVKVTDDQHVQPYRELESDHGDCLDLAFDPLNDGTRGRWGGDDLRFGVALADGAGIVRRNVGKPPGLVKEITARVERVGDKGDCRYFVAIPWSQLAPMQPKPSAQFGFDLRVNDNDSDKREGWVDWPGALGDRPSPLGFAMITLGK